MKQCEEEIRDGCRRAAEEIEEHRRRIIEVQDEGAAGSRRDQQPRYVRHRLLEDLGDTPRLLIEPDAGVAVALPEPLHGNHEVRPHGLPTEIAAPDAPGDRADEEEAKRGDNQEAGDEIEFLRPDLEAEEEQAAIGHVDQDRLIRKPSSAIPPNPRSRIIDAHADEHHEPLYIAEKPACELGIDFLPAGVLKAFGLPVDGADVDLLDAGGCLAGS